MSDRGNKFNNFNYYTRDSFYQNTKQDNDNLIKNININYNNEIPEIIPKTPKIASNKNDIKNQY